MFATPLTLMVLFTSSQEVTPKRSAFTHSATLPSASWFPATNDNAEMKTARSQINILSDGHVHTRLCNHAIGEMEEYVLAALEIGLQEIIFLEHLEIDINVSERTWLSEEEFDYYFEEGDRLRNLYADRIQIGTGVELGYNSEHQNELLDKIAARPWDRVGISCHFLKIPATGLHLNLLSRKSNYITIAQQYGAEKLLHRYFDTLLLAVQQLPGSVLCHLDAALRHVPEITFSNGHYQQIDRIMAAVKEKGMALELNTSGITMRNEVFPTRKMLAIALKYEIPLVAGSDAHRPQDVGRFFDTLPDYITSAACP